MKKILVVLLVLAVAGGVFAQEGTWSLSGGVRLNTTINLDGKAWDTGNVVDAATVWGGRYLDGLGDNGDEPRGFLNIAYSRSGIRAGINFRVTPNTWDGIFNRQRAFGNYYNNGLMDVFAEYKTDRYMFYIETPFRLMLNGNGGEIAATNTTEHGSVYSGGVSIARLWGYYELLDKMVHLEAGYRGADKKWWVSDDTAYKGDYWTNTQNADVDGDRKRSTFLTNVKINNIEFGILVPNVFNTYYFDATNPPSPTSDPVNLTKNANNKPTYPYGALVEGALMKSAFGVKFDMSPVQLAAQFLFEDAGVYLGAKYFAGPVTVGFSFQGIMQPPSTYKVPVLAGLNLEYKQDAFYAQVKVLYGLNGNDDTGATTSLHGVKGASSILNYADATDPALRITGAGAAAYADRTTIPQTAFGIEPTFYYNVIPEYFRFRIDAGFYFRGTEIAWKLIPQITWNMLGTGADGMGGPSTAIGAKYALRNEYPKRSLLSVYFKLGF